MRKTLSASGNFRSIGAGMVFTLEKAYRDDLNISWVVVSASFSASQQEGGVDYAVSFTAIPADHTFRPLPRTPRPSLNLQTAYVVGPPGAPIYMDDYGRAKVHFHWDLDHPYDPTASCWIRVAQQYAGMNAETGDKHGFHWHPLVGDEVVVDFLEGDPDNPLIVGSVYNYVNMQLRQARPAHPQRDPLAVPAPAGLRRQGEVHPGQHPLSAHVADGRSGEVHAPDARNTRTP